MPVPPTNGSSQSAPSAVPANPKGDMSSQDTFMKLLVAELKHQDPMDPMQSRDMVAQLAQLSSVQKLSTIDDKLAGLQRGSIEGASLQSANLIGKTVTAQTNRLTLNGFNTPAGAYRLNGDADNVTIQVTDGQGQAVRSLELGAQKSGGKTFEWDGRDSSGRRVPNGMYSFRIDATNAQGAPVLASTEVSGLVSEISYSNGAPEVVVGNVHVGISDVTSVAQ